MYRVIIIFILLAAIGGGLKYYENQQFKWGQEKAELEAAAALCQQNLAIVRNEREAFRRASVRLGSELERATESKRELQRIFQEHDFTNLAIQKPGLIERRVNDATKEVFDGLEQQSRAVRVHDVPKED